MATAASRKSCARASAPVRWLLALLAVAAVAPIAGCGGGDEPDKRTQVDRYIKRANAVEHRFAADFDQANNAYLAYARGELSDDRAADDMAAAERAIRMARRELAGLHPPADARPLHEKLVRYVDMNLAIAGEMTRLAGYVPGAARALQPVERANRRLRRRLDAAQGPAYQARALRRFDAELARVLHQLRKLPVPTVLHDDHRDQIRGLTVTRRLARRLEAALSDQDAAAVARLVVRLRKSASNSPRVRERAAEAIRRYNRRVRALNDAYAGVQREHARLDRALD